MTLTSKLGTRRRAEFSLANGGFADTTRHGRRFVRASPLRPITSPTCAINRTPAKRRNARELIEVAIVVEHAHVMLQRARSHQTSD
jgi:hypothetical protein